MHRRRSVVSARGLDLFNVIYIHFMSSAPELTSPDPFDHREPCEFFQFGSLLSPVFVSAGPDNTHLIGITFADLWDWCSVVPPIVQNVFQLSVVLLFFEHKTC
jgi:hypothetical protein